MPAPADRRRAGGAPDAPPPRDGGPRPLPYRVARWGKFWSLEPLFADARACLLAKGGRAAQAGRHRAGRARARRPAAHRRGARASDDLAVVLRALLYARGLPQGFADDVLDEAAAVGGRGDAARPRAPRPVRAADVHHRPRHGARLRRRHLGAARRRWLSRARAHRRRLVLRRRRRRDRARGAAPYVERVPAALRRAHAAGGAQRRPLQPGAPRGAQVRHRRAELGGGRAPHGRAVLPLAHRQRPPAHLRLRRHDHRPAGRGRRRGPRAPTGEAGAADADVPDGAAPRADVPGATFTADEELAARLRLAAEVAGLLRRRRLARGALSSARSSPSIAFDGTGALSGAEARPETPSHALVEEFMLAANEAVAEFLLRKRGRTLYRVHEPPGAGQRARTARCARGARRAHTAVPGRRRPCRRPSSPRRSAA